MLAAFDLIPRSKPDIPFGRQQTASRSRIFGDVMGEAVHVHRVSEVLSNVQFSMVGPRSTAMKCDRRHHPDAVEVPQPENRARNRVRISAASQGDSPVRSPASTQPRTGYLAPRP